MLIVLIVYYVLVLIGLTQFSTKGYNRLQSILIQGLISAVPGLNLFLFFVGLDKVVSYFAAAVQIFEGILTLLISVTGVYIVVPFGKLMIKIIGPPAK